MLCQSCETNQATMFIKQTVNGINTEIHLCEQCAKDRVKLPEIPDPFSFHKFLFGMINGEQITQNKPSQQTIICPTCNLTMKKFSETGKFGCENCYSAFENQLPMIFKNFQAGNLFHHGKVPQRIMTASKGDLAVETPVAETPVVENPVAENPMAILNQQLGKLKLELQQAISVEKFEQAATLRDQIYTIEQQIREAADHV